MEAGRNETVREMWLAYCPERDDGLLERQLLDEADATEA